jgi:hypothetical protein
MFTNLLRVLALSLASVASGQQHTIIVDFEEFAEDTKITDQYSGLGVWFATVGSASNPPIIAREGNPIRAFAAPQPDGAMASGSAGLTDPVIGGDYAKTSDIAVSFSPPVTSVQFYAADIDSEETLTLRAYSNGSQVAVTTVNSSSSGAGDGRSTLMKVSAASIDRVVLEPRKPGNGLMGWAMDFLVFTRACEVQVCPPALVRVSQESVPNAGDFAENFLGYTGYFLTGTDAKSLYAYNAPDVDSYNGPLFRPVTNRSHVVLATTTDAGVIGHEVSLLVIHDEPYSNTNGGGACEMKIQTIGDCSQNLVTVFDDPTSKDPGDKYTGASGSCEFTAKHAYSTENTDGFAIRGLDVDGSVYLSFANVDGNTNTPAISGLDSWAVVSPDGSEIMLSLQEGRRVKLDLVPPCIADFDRSGFVDLDDFVLFVTVFGDGGDAADVDRSGFVDTDDFTFFVLAFEAGC